MRTFIERVRADRRDAIDELDRWKRMRAEGWTLSVLHDRSSRPETLVAFGFLPDDDVQLELRDALGPLRT